MSADDELDQLLRGAMKTLDDSIPSGYFEALPNRIQERLEMQTTSSTGGPQIGNAGLMTMTTKADDSEPKAESSSGSVKREEDSGLHDIRSLAKSTRMRVSQNIPAVRPGTNSDDDLLASASSSGWKSAVALPEPARMISLPEIGEMPSKADIKKQVKEEKAAASKKSVEKIVAAGSAPAIEAAAGSTPALATVTPIGAGRARAMVAAAPAKAGGGTNTMKIVLGAGLGVAAAAGIVIFVMARGGGGSAADQTKAAGATAVAMTVTPAPPEPAVQRAAAPPAAAPAIAADPAPADDAKAEVAMASPDVASAAAGSGAAKAPAKTAAHLAVGGGSATKKADEDKTVVATGKAKDEPKKIEKGAKPGAQGEGEPSFDKLLDEAGVDKNAAPKTAALDKKQLTGDDFKHGMAGVTGAAMACYAGTQGTATIKLVIAPTGKVSKVSVSGVFSGKAEATCVANAVRGASFPAWDGGPQTFGYSYLLQEK